MKTYSLMKSRRAFTLIELLVVIAIIALLAAILFPVFARARENARKSSCLNNTKQMGIALLSYAQDFDETYTLNDGPTGRWADRLQPYVKSQQIFLCPSTSASTPGLHTTPGGIRLTYLLNSVYRGGADIKIFEQHGPPATLAAIEDVTNTTAFCDGSWGFQFINVEGTYGAPVPANAITTGNPNFIDSDQADIQARHLDFANCAFLDGHSKAMRLEELIKTGTNSAGVSRYRYFSAEKD